MVPNIACHEHAQRQGAGKYGCRKVVSHLNKRVYFCDYLMLTGIFNQPELDIEHRDLYQQILNNYLQQHEQRQMHGYYGNPNLETQ